MNQSAKKRLSPTVWYLFAGLSACVLGFAISAFCLPTWGAASAGTPESLAAIHTLVLGGLLTIAAGVLYQVVSIAFQAPPLPRHVALWHLPAHAVAVILMVGGFVAGDWRLVGVGGSLLVAGLAAYGAFLARSYRLARNKTHVHRLLWLPGAFFVWVAAAGLWQAFSPETETPALLLTHIAAGALGFWTGLVMIISYKFIPMFSLSHGYKISAAKTAAWWFGGLAILLFSHLPAIFAWRNGLPQPMYALTLAGCLAALAGLVSFTVDAWRILGARKRKTLVKPMRSALFALAVILLASVLSLASIALNWRGLAFLAGYLLLFCGLLPLAFSYVQKIVPFLWFEYRFSHRPERKTAPALDDMVPERWIAAAERFYLTGVACGLPVIVIRSLPTALTAILAGAFGILCAAATVILMVSLRRVLLIGGPRPTE